LDDAIAQRAIWLVTTRGQAIQNPVVMRARDLVCGVLSQLPFQRTNRNGATMPIGWLDRPDPNHTRGWFVSMITDDLFFYGFAYARITVRDFTNRPLALEWVPFTAAVVKPEGTGLLWQRRGWDLPGPQLAAQVQTVDLLWRDVVVFESPLTAVLQANEPLSLASLLQSAAVRFAGVEMPAGTLKQTGGDDADDPTKLVADFETARLAHVTAYLSQDLEYHESTMDPSRLQLIEARSYQDAATARVCNVPAFAVGVGVPHESMTYKTAATARLDLIDFGIAPYLGCWEQTLSSDQVSPAGSTIGFDLEPFLRTQALSHLGVAGGQPGDVAAVPTGQEVG
jgi:phage portal protein BeeE